MLKELGARGFRVNTIGELRQSNAEYRAAVPILLHWLSRISDPQVKEDIVRTLSVPWAKPAAAPALIEEFRKAESGEIRWAIANGLAVIADDAVFEELAELVYDKGYGKAREMLALALGNMQDSRAVIVLMDLLNDEQVMGVVRKNSVTHRKAQGSIRDAIRRGSDWHGLHRIPRDDGANWPFGSRTTRAADREHPDRVPCAGARRCNGGSTISERIADAMRIAGSTNPDTRGESYQ
ncbi:MAG: HEAT repeat domain-containing protein [Gammaproteobacteria bacterium]|nr:MAG: HEAT repeat domain-containing protein [Gammaproteobacteria bacterium]